MKYIFANVKIPIKVSDQNEYSIVSERIYTTIEPCHELPPVNENQSQGVFDQIESILSQSIGVEENTEDRDEVKDDSEVKDDCKDERENKTKEDKTEVKLVLQQQHDFLKKNVTFRNRNAFKHNKSKKHRVHLQHT